MWKITPLPVLNDNYIWLIEQAQNVIIIDPAVAEPVLAHLQRHQQTPIAILLTHNHHDHTDGVKEIVRHYPNLAVYGSAEVAEWATHLVHAGEQFVLGDLTFEVLDSAGHTAQHISYLMNREALFCGDALFSGGCGRVFTGDYQAQFDTLQRFNALPDFVAVYCGHEYTQSNLKFAETVSSSCELLEYQEQVDILRHQQRPSLPTTIGLEKRINPFLRADSVEAFTRLRQAKDRS